MPKKIIETLEDINSPKALIIGGANIASVISSRLQQGGCQVTQIERLSSLAENVSSYSFSKFDYICQFGNFEFINQIIKKFLKTTGKIILIESDEEEVKSIITDQRIKIIRIGTLSLWNIDDLVSKILKTLFSTGSVKVYDIRKKLPTASLKPKPIKTDIRYSASISTSLRSKYRVETDIDRFDDQIHVKRKTLKAKLVGITLFACLVLIVGFIASLYFYLNSTFLTTSQLVSSFESSNFSQVTKSTRQLRGKINVIDSVFDLVVTVFFPLKNNSFITDVDSFFTSTLNILDATQELVDIIQNLDKNRTGFSQKRLSLTNGDFETYSYRVDNLISSLADQKKKLAKLDIPIFSIDKYNLVLTSTLDRLISFSQTLPIIEKLLITDSPKTYLLLFQNNMELRPTGGFIGSFALLIIDDGWVSEFKIMDVYDADGQLKGHVEPPVPIRKYLNQPNWFLRDSNFDPDFAESAVQVSWFLDKELGVKVDGVIGINLFFVQNLLRAIGTIKVSDFKNEEVTADNFFYKAHNFSQQDFFPGSTQKKDFLSALSKEIEKRLFDDNSLPWLELFSITRNSLNDKSIMVYSFDSELQKLLEETGWAGRIIKVGCVDKIEGPCFPDYLAINEANLGVNKANYLVNKSVAVDKKIDTNGQIINTVTLSYENRGLPEVFSGGDYVNYLRLFVRKDSKLQNVLFNNLPISADEIDVGDYGEDKTYFGFLVKIAPSEKAVVKVSYALSDQLLPTTSSYQFLYQKQPGDKTSPLVLTFTFTEGYSFKALNFSPSQSESNSFSYLTDTAVDRIFALSRSQEN